ncbi:MAG: hypothetical protein ACRDHW_11930, partial [Ktedonobacteraceae bacterium]
MKKALATLLYSGTPQQAQDFGIPFTVRQLQAVNATRNLLVLSHATGIPPAPPGVSRCSKCAMQDQCSQISTLLGWQPPELLPPEHEAEPTDENMVAAQHPQTNGQKQDGLAVKGGQAAPKRPATLELAELTPEDREFFALYYRLLQQEGYEIEKQQALLWHTPVGERVARGSTISDLVPLGEPVSTGQGEWQQTFRCVNTSELREGEEVLLSDGDPITGEVVTGTILSVSSEQVRVWTPELIAYPALLDR